jgi:hypothetical protein
MKKYLKLQIGSIAQINPEKHPDFGGDFVIVKEVNEFGIHGYLAQVYVNECVRFKGVAYIRLKWEDFELVGYTEWKLEHKNDDEMDYQNDNQSAYQDDRSK